MSTRVNRRDFLKLAGMLPLGMAAPRLAHSLRDPHGGQNVIVVVFDALSSYNVDYYGYPRETMPNLARLAKKAVVYRNHIAGGNFTTTGTASLLTGVLPWTHRAFNHNGTVIDPFVKQNIFGAFKNYYKIAYTHNGWAYTLLKQFSGEIDELIPREKLLLASYDRLVQKVFSSDDDIATVGWARNFKIQDEGHAYSLFLSHLFRRLQEAKVESLKPTFPRGLPTTGSDNGFLLEDAIEWITDRFMNIPHPFVGYFHFLPPHHPYRTSVEFFDTFLKDGFKTADKPKDIFARIPFNDLGKRRREYDEFLLYCDRQFARFYKRLEDSGLLENTWLVFTSDHGEMFERGIAGHSTDALYEPVVRVPLLIFEPGRETGLEVNDLTSAIDVLPTLFHLTGQDIPGWLEGQVLPPYASARPDSDRNVYVMRASKNPKLSPLTEASTTLVKGHYKLHYYFGYSEVEREGLVKLFDLESDPEEMFDLYTSKNSIALALFDELKVKLDQVNLPYL